MFCLVSHWWMAVTCSLWLTCYYGMFPITQKGDSQRIPCLVLVASYNELRQTKILTQAARRPGPCQEIPLQRLLQLAKRPHGNSEQLYCWEAQGVKVRKHPQLGPQTASLNSFEVPMGHADDKSCFSTGYWLLNQVQCLESATVSYVRFLKSTSAPISDDDAMFQNIGGIWWHDFVWFCLHSSGMCGRCNCFALILAFIPADSLD